VIADAAVNLTVNHAQHHAGDDAPGGNLAADQDDAADEDGQGAGFTDRAVNGADEGVHPGDAAARHRVSS